jgi:hypothetical protein
MRVFTGFDHGVQRVCAVPARGMGMKNENKRCQPAEILGG